MEEDDMFVADLAVVFAFLVVVAALVVVNLM